LICPTPSVICLPYYLKFLTLFVVFIGGWFGYEISGFVFGDKLFSIKKGEVVGKWKNIMSLIMCTARHEEWIEPTARISSNKKFEIAGYI
jgi:hypothetical protein